MPGDPGPCREGCPVCALQGRTSAPTPFDAALAALDVEPTHHTDRMVTTYDILGLDAVRAAHRAEVERAVREAVEQERDACRVACIGVLCAARGRGALLGDLAKSWVEECIAAIRARGAKS